ncbi:MAG: relaxase/mobilization nuclease domain-containing protein [Bacteroidota bacterium]|nr:relaxase/mobilization nuclease domain-containing protein [Bacteroidota bacterium]
MIVKILSSASKDFHGVKYNDKKINKGSGELMMMKNFPSFLDKNSTQEEVGNYLKSISNSDRVKKPQFHAVLSTKNQEHNKEQLTQLAEEFMKEMGYEKQPFIVVFHNDTENNHVHIVSTRVDKQTGLKINDSYEKIKSQRALNKAMEKVLNVRLEERLNDLMKYKYSNYQQFEKLLTRKGFKVVLDEKDKVHIFKNGDLQKSLNLDKLNFSNDYQKDSRSKQLKEIILKYKGLYSATVFKVIDNRKEEGLFDKDKPIGEQPKIEFESELQQKLRDIFGVDIIFHHKDDKKPFGYTLIDNATQKVYKGSEIVKMSDVFDFSDAQIQKRDFERIKAYNLKSSIEKKILLDFLQKQNPEIKDFMLFENKKKTLSKENYMSLKNEVKEHINSGGKGNQNIVFLKDTEGTWYVNHQRYHYIGSLESIVGQKGYERFVGGKYQEVNTLSKPQYENKATTDIVKGIFDVVDDVLYELGKNEYGGKDDTENKLNKKKKKKRRR